MPDFAMDAPQRRAGVETPSAQSATSEAVTERHAEDYHTKDNRRSGAQCPVIPSAFGLHSEFRMDFVSECYSVLLLL